MTASTANPRYAIVTGGASGLGREFCLRLARDGWEIAIVDIDRGGAEETARLVAQAGGASRCEIFDVTSIAAWGALCDQLQAQWPRLDLLVNNAGTYASGNVGFLDLIAAERLIQLNLHGVLYGCHTMVPWLVASAKAKRTAVINVASAFAFICPPGMAPYNLSKAAVVALSETLHGELMPRGVGVTAVCPGPMATRFLENATFDSAAFRRLTASYLQESRLKPADVVAAAIDAVQQNKLYMIAGADQRWLWRLKRLLPVTLLGRVARRVRKDLAKIANQLSAPRT